MTVHTGAELFKGGNYSRAETISGNTVYALSPLCYHENNNGLDQLWPLDWYTHSPTQRFIRSDLLVLSQTRAKGQIFSEQIWPAWHFVWSSSLAATHWDVKHSNETKLLYLGFESKIISRKSGLMPCLKTILNCFLLENRAFKTKHLKVS